VAEPATAVAELLAGYAAANDLRDVGLISECFTPDGAFILHIAGSDTIGPLQPRRDLLAFFGAAFGAQSDQRRHVVTNVRLLESDDDRARVEAYLTLIVTDGGRTALQSAGRYDAEVVRDVRGWRFRSLTLFLDSPF
jgi:uncharacterized protein (TIGR02246 family)